MLQLPNGCTSSIPAIYPKNWKTGGQSLLKKEWYIYYRFCDPKHPEDKNGKLVIVKRLSKYATLQDRKDAAVAIQEHVVDQLTRYQFNPYTKTRVDPADEIYINYEIDPRTLFIQALEAAMKKIDVQRETKRDMKSIVKYTRTAAINLRYDRLEIQEVRRKHIKVLLDEIGRLPIIDPKGNKVPRVWSEHRYNVYWKYLHRLFEELIEIEACEYNPVAKISKKIVIKKMRETMSVEERRRAINEHLKPRFYTFYRFCQIFFHSGARMTELLKVKVKDVDLVRQRYKITVIKGKRKAEEWATIKDIALPFWTELVHLAPPQNFIFSNDLKPGPNWINAKNITRRWHDHVKVPLGIKADIYSLKHSNLDETAAILDVKAAQETARHTTPVITIERYLGGEKDRQHARLKTVNNDL